MSFCPDHGDDENPWKRQCTREKIVKLERGLAAVAEQSERYRLKTLVLDAKIADVTAQRDALRELNATLTTERDCLLAEKDNPETTWDDTVEINKLRAELTASQQEVARLRAGLNSQRNYLLVSKCDCSVQNEAGDVDRCGRCWALDDIDDALSSTPATVHK